MGNEPLDMTKLVAEARRMTTTSMHNEITGDTVARGQIIQVTDDFHGIHGLLTMFVLEAAPVAGERYVDGVVVQIDTTYGVWHVFGDAIVTVADLEPVGLVGTMDPADWSADYARRIALG